MGHSTPKPTLRIRQYVVDRDPPETAALDDIPQLTPQDVAACTGLSYHAGLRSIHRGELVASKLGGRVRIRRSDLLMWIEACRLQLELDDDVADSGPPALGSRRALRAIERRSG